MQGPNKPSTTLAQQWTNNGSMCPVCCGGGGVHYQYRSAKWILCMYGRWKEWCWRRKVVQRSTSTSNKQAAYNDWQATSPAKQGYAGVKKDVTSVSDQLTTSSVTGLYDKSVADVNPMLAMRWKTSQMMFAWQCSSCNHETLTCGPASQTLAQHLINIGFTSCVCCMCVTSWSYTLWVY